MRQLVSGLAFRSVGFVFSGLAWFGFFSSVYLVKLDCLFRLGPFFGLFFRATPFFSGVGKWKNGRSSVCLLLCLVFA